MYSIEISYKYIHDSVKMHHFLELTKHNSGTQQLLHRPSQKLVWELRSHPVKLRPASFHRVAISLIGMHDVRRRINELRCVAVTVSALPNTWLQNKEEAQIFMTHVQIPALEDSHPMLNGHGETPQQQDAKLESSNVQHPMCSLHVVKYNTAIIRQNWRRQDANNYAAQTEQPRGTYDKTLKTTIHWNGESFD